MELTAGQTATVVLATEAAAEFDGTHSRIVYFTTHHLLFAHAFAPTAEGRRVLEQLAGFREFLVRVEQDRLQRLNTASEKAELMNEFLPYAIALNVREGWGDSLAAAFSNAIVER